MAHVTIRGLRKVFGGHPGTVAIDDVDLELQEGEFLVLLGPSGCGKTTTLRCIAGLETPDAGQISIGDAVVFDASDGRELPPDKCDIGMVFQAYGLWPHMTVRRNLAYPLKSRRSRKHARPEWVEETARMVDCSQLLDRYPAQLSGGQQQRVALARGLVARPAVVLFDEPLSNLDARLREQVRAELHRLHRDLRFTAVFVTHDQDEALALADRIAVMRAGAIEQIDTPERIFASPATEYVADFMGMTNVVGVAEGPDGIDCVDGPTDAVARLRPESMRLCRADGSDVDPAGSRVRLSFLAALDTVQYRGLVLDVVVQSPHGRSLCSVPIGESTRWLLDVPAGEPVRVEFDRTDARIFDRASGVRRMDREAVS